MSTGGKKAPPRPPVGGPASRAQPFSPGDGGAKRGNGPMKVIGERRPDETGMLEMVPLAADKDKNAAAEDPSATAFFAIPAPKADRSRSTPAAPQAPGYGAPVGVSPPSGPPGPPPVRPPIGVGQAAPPPPMQPIVQGPVVSYGNAGGGSPFQVAGQGPVANPSADSGGRVQSNRVYAILVGVFLLVAVAVVVAVWLIPKGKEEVASTPPPTTTPTVVVEKTAKVEEDTAPPPVAAPVAPKPKAKTPAAPKAAPAPAKGPGTLSVTLADAAAATAVEVVCPSGFRQRTALSGGKGSVPSVPQEACTMYFKGGAPAQFAPVSGGRSLNCSIRGTTAVCN